MDPRFLPFQIAAGFFLAGAIIACIKSGLNIYRNNNGWRGAFGAILFLGAMALAGAVTMAGFGA